MYLTAQIITDFKAGRLDSFYKAAYADMLTYAARLLGEHHSLMAEDVVQDVIFQSYQRRDSISDVRQWKSFLFRSVHNAVVSIHRNYAAQQRYLSQQEQMEEDFTHTFIQQETFERLFAAIDQLPERHRQIFQLSFEQGLANAEISELLQVSTRTIVKNKSQMLQMLKERMTGTAGSEATTLVISLVSWLS